MLTALCFSHAHPVCPALVRQPRIDFTGYTYVRILSRDPVLFGKHPYTPRSVVDLVDTLAQRSIGTRNPTHYSHFPIVVTPGVIVYLGDSHSRGASCHQ